MVYNNENISFINRDSYNEPDVFIYFLSHESLNKKEETKENNRKEWKIFHDFYYFCNF